MPVYKSPEGVVYNLDKFVLFEVKPSGYHGQRDAGPLCELVGKTETDDKVTIYSDKSAESEAKCNAELDKICKELRKPAILDAQIERRLQEIYAALSKIGMFTEVQAKLLAGESNEKE